LASARSIRLARIPAKRNPAPDLLTGSAAIEIPFPQRDVHVVLEEADDPTGGREATGSPRDR